MINKSLLTLPLATLAMGVGAKAKMTQMPEYIEGEYLVKLKDGYTKSFLAEKTAGMEVTQTMNLTIGDVAVVKTTLKSYQAMDLLKSNPAVEIVEPNYIYRAIDTVRESYADIRGILTNDPRFDKLWGLKNTGANEPAGSRGNSSPSGKAGADVNAEAAWQITKGSDNVVIAVIDTGVDYNHEDLRANAWVNEAEKNGRAGVDDDGNGYVDDVYGYDFANNDGDPMDDNGHGTHCSGTIAAEHDNAIGIAGVMANAKIMGIKFLTGSGSGSLDNAVRSIDYATKMNVDIMSNSWGGGGFSQIMKQSIEAAKNKGIVFTAAAGNSASDNDQTPHYPSNYQVDNVISVAAHNYNDQMASFTCYGKRTVHVAAPGRNILSTTPGDSYAVYSGTSMATPHVTGVVGLYIAEHGRTNVKTLRDKLMASSIFGTAYRRTTVGMGRVDAYNFLTGVTAARPEMPNENDWVNRAQVYESAHPYANSYENVETINIPGAKFIRVVIEKYELENRYDKLYIQDAGGNTMEAITGSGTNYVSEYVEGDTLKLKFKSDSSVNKWGYKVTKVQFIR
jgi:thermitase